ncbi:MAG: hypothetical protein HC848_05335 [Limnobacter sp.]|nr:hypothetical protein [Limnobacter sp.]
MSSDVPPKGSTPEASIQYTQQQIAAIDGLEQAGVDVEGLGLAALRTDCQAALDKYDKSIASGVDPNTAASVLRGETALAKLDYYTASGLSDSSPLVQSAQKQH